MPAYTATPGTLQSAATGNGNGTQMPVAGFVSALVHVVSSPSMSGGTTVNFEASVDGTTWAAVYGQQVGSQAVATSTTADGDFRVTVAGFGFLRARISGYSAGTVTVTAFAVDASAPPIAPTNLGAGTATAASLPASGSYVWTGAAWEAVRSANVYKSIAVTAVTAGTPLTVWTPTAGKKFRYLGGFIVASATCQLIFKDGGTEFMRGPNGTTNSIGPNVIGVLGYLSTAINNALSLDVTASGNLSGFVCGTEE